MLHVKTLDPVAAGTDLLVVPVCEDEELYAHPVFSSMVARARKFEEFNGEAEDELILFDPPGVQARRALLVGLGPIAKLDRERLRCFSGRAVKRALQKKLKDVTFIIPDLSAAGLDSKASAAAMMEGACLAHANPGRYQTGKKKKALQRIDYLVPPDAHKDLKHVQEVVEEICGGTLLAREWVNLPPNDKQPAAFARLIARTARKKGLKAEVFGKKELVQKKFGAILAVGSASSGTPALVVIDYSPRGVSKTVVLVGKGVTFDSGGLNLKPSKSLSMMKSDMAGAAAVSAVMLAAARLKPKLRLIALLPLAENMLSGSATRPGDIIRTYSGKTVEIGNTDAEGRLILADAIAYAREKYRPDLVIDMATLTGACVTALGEGIAGLFANDDAIAGALLRAAEKTHERCWRMPLPEDYRELLKSELADINNMPSSRSGGAISAALFLSEFVGDTPWAHIDIAGTAFHKKGNDYCGPGATGFGVRLLCEVLQDLAG
jgi:leucyl aminopeptidase